MRRDDENDQSSSVDAGDVHGAVWLKSVAVQPDRTTCERKQGGARIPSVQIVGDTIDRPQVRDDCGEQFRKLGFEVGGIRPPGAVDATDRHRGGVWGSGLSLSLSRGICPASVSERMPTGAMVVVLCVMATLLVPAVKCEPTSLRIGDAVKSTITGAQSPTPSALRS